MNNKISYLFLVLSIKVESTEIICNKTVGLGNNTVRVFTSNFDGEDITFRVVNGFLAELGEVPYQVALMKSLGRVRKYRAVCGGSIIGPSKVVSAAHCIYKKKFIDCYPGKRYEDDYQSTAIVAGQLKTTAIYGVEGQWRKYVKVPFRYNQYVLPIAIASKNIDYGGKECLASGYGRTNLDMDDPTQSTHLLKASLRVLSARTCNMVHGSDFSKFVCTSDTVSDARQGDSGGPLVCRDTGDPAENGSQLGLLVGVVSGKTLGIRSGTFFTRVSFYHELLSGSTQINISPYISSFSAIVLINQFMLQF